MCMAKFMSYLVFFQARFAYHVWDCGKAFDDAPKANPVDTAPRIVQPAHQNAR